MNNSNHNNNDDDDDNILIMHCSVQLMCATTFSKEFPTSEQDIGILRAGAIIAVVGWRRFEQATNLTIILYLCCTKIVKDPTYAILFVGLETFFLSKFQWNNRIDTHHIHSHSLLLPIIIILYF